MFKLFRRGQKGFTLIELLVVIAILGVLAAVALPNVIGLMNAGNAAAANAEMATVQTACDGYLMSNPSTSPSTLITGGVPIAGVLSLIRSGAVKGQYTIDANGTVAASGIGSWIGISVDTTKTPHCFKLGS